ncbi:MAG TPA: hypothetical protein VF283_20625 [Bryobacteraceae bacterium]
MQAAVEEGAFEAIPEFAAAYRRAILRRLGEMEDPAARSALLEQAQATLHRSRQLVQARRRRLSEQLSVTTGSLHTWQVEG